MILPLLKVLKDDMLPYCISVCLADASSVVESSFSPCCSDGEKDCWLPLSSVFIIPRSLSFSSSFSCLGCWERSACALSCVFTQSRFDSEVWLGRETVARWSEMWAEEELLCFFSVPSTTSFFFFSFYLYLFRKYCCIESLEVMTII